MPAWLALLAGIAVAVARPAPAWLKPWTSRVLQVGVMLLGAGVPIGKVLTVGVDTALVTALTIAATLSLGLLLGRVLRVPAETALLLSVGTAICGGSAIAAVGGVIKAKPHELAVAMGVVFVLNGVALLVAPSLAQALHLTPEHYGRWVALAVHDTSSVVGAAMAMGPQALAIATTAKLGRALWIVPITVGVALARGRSTEGVRWPWFIAGFLALAVLEPPHADLLVAAGRALTFVALFMVGATLSPSALREIGPRPLVHGVLLWLATGVGAYFITG